MEGGATLLVRPPTRPAGAEATGCHINTATRKSKLLTIPATDTAVVTDANLMVRVAVNFGGDALPRKSMRKIVVSSYLLLTVHLVWTLSIFYVVFFNASDVNSLSFLNMYIFICDIAWNLLVINALYRQMLALHCNKVWVTQDQFSLVSKKDFGIPKDNFNINIEVFKQTFTNVELLRYKHIPNVELFRWRPSNLLKFFTNVELLR